MEEKETTQNMPSYEELQNIAMHFQQRAVNAESRLQAINMTTTRLTYLFKVLENKSAFPEEFVTECANEVMELLKIEEETPETEQEQPD